MKSDPEGSFYLPADDPDSWLPTPATAGPWSDSAQHGGPPSALLTRALARALGAEQVLARISIDLLGPVPLGPLRVATAALRPGRRVSLVEATLHDETAGRPCAVARAWALPRSDSGPGTTTPPGHAPTQGRTTSFPEGWSPGYIDHVDWHWVAGSVGRPGPATVWMRPRVPLLPDEPLTGFPMLMACVDSASGVSAVLDLREWTFMNTELTVHLLREPVGEWVCLDAETTLGPSAVGVATSVVHDELGIVARSAQTLMVVPREG
ncbi:thioesterase family protein [Nocardioides donggukensis]|uniref:Thioesterase family protein n=1 Tax=Nocardioides donggukensis TaxID=2774019 RepID=A0A927K5P2_9ACTN|nr:thioesterase family protein [Nocardioides donggukensis]MBD8870757.1 thioesterase family protein [Nocardioides donggukensis]